jgi:hypothetical protein
MAPPAAGRSKPFFVSSITFPMLRTFHTAVQTITKDEFVVGGLKNNRGIQHHQRASGRRPRPTVQSDETTGTGIVTTRAARRGGSSGSRKECWARPLFHNLCYPWAFSTTIRERGTNPNCSFVGAVDRPHGTNGCLSMPLLPTTSTSNDDGSGRLITN